MAFDFRCTLLREKFTLSDPAQPMTEPVVALSNRIALPLIRDRDGVEMEVGEREDFIIRAQNMHSCARFAAAIVREFSERGPIMARKIPFRWEILWADVIKGYEKDWNPHQWCAVYYKGRLVYADGERHPFLDIIEKCDAASGDDYARSIAFAEKAFGQAGRATTIHHESNVALVITVTAEEARCGVILRMADKKTTFNFMVKPKPREALEKIVAIILTASAAYLEGIQLAFHVGTATRKEELGLIEKHSDEKRKLRRDNDRLNNLSLQLKTMEAKNTFHYRPERPNFQEIAGKAAELAGKRILSELPPEEAHAPDDASGLDQ